MAIDVLAEFTIMALGLAVAAVRSVSMLLQKCALMAVMETHVALDRVLARKGDGNENCKKAGSVQIYDGYLIFNFSFSLIILLFKYNKQQRKFFTNRFFTQSAHSE